ncbi:hypothetical protein QJS10_CPA03g01515 [Acorus calamus]|uniref:SAWADEE domain-containing protein n=1 Tax=Acorus calamus TaxID=4465 RepID=A0AAV9FAW4_ACOCL|nr:hypothetical protein QJS10_CPA03g01515 [Acorus calamus]
MADASSIEDFDLEVMDKNDGSWRPCTVSLDTTSYSGVNLTVDIQDSGSGNIMLKKEEALARLRFRSTPLQNNECGDIKEGDHVLAEGSGGMFYDAKIEKVGRVRHSSRAHCRCTFEIRWLHAELKGETASVSSTAIMKLVEKDIKSHHVVVAFLEYFDEATCSDMLPSLSHCEHGCENDLQISLEKQIDKIGKLIREENRCSGEILLGIKRVDPTRSKCGKSATASQINSHNLRSTRSQNKQHEREDMNLTFPSSTLMENVDSKPLLSPLAARAALASLLHELPVDPEISKHHDEESGIALSSKDGNTNNQAVSVSCMIMNHDIDIQENLSTSKDSSRSRKVPSKKSRMMGEASEIKNNQDEQAEQNSPVIAAGLSHSSVIQKQDSTKTIGLELSMESRRLTRSKVLKGEGSLSSDVKEEPMKREFIQNNLTKINGQELLPMENGRLTRSKMLKAGGSLSSEVEEPKKRKLVQDNSTKIIGQELPMENGTPLKMMKAEGGLSFEVKDESEKSGLIHMIQQNPSVEDHVSEPKKMRGKKLVSTCSDLTTNASEERKKRLRSSNATNIDDTQETGKSHGGDKQKVVSSKKPQLRFSPRLRFLPRTRSQKT